MKHYFSLPLFLKSTKFSKWCYDNFEEAAHQHDKAYGKWGAIRKEGKSIHYTSLHNLAGKKRINIFQADNYFFIDMIKYSKDSWYKVIPFALFVRFIFIFVGVFLWTWNKVDK